MWTHTASRLMLAPSRLTLAASRLTLAATLTLAVPLIPQSPALKTASGDGLMETEHTFEFRTRSDADLTAWALEQFDRSGLVLPPLTIAFHDDREDCGGHFGLFRAGEPAHVDICGFNRDRFVVTARKTVLHELGHAWTAHTLDEQDRQAFLILRNLSTWGDDEFPWNEQGSEQAAEIIAWALMDQEVQLATMSSTHPQALADAYLELTGSLPISRLQAALIGHTFLH